MKRFVEVIPALNSGAKVRSAKYVDSVMFFDETGALVQEAFNSGRPYTYSLDQDDFARQDWSILA